MIFVTVGTGESPFDRLIEKIDNLCQVGAFNEEVFIQTSYTEYIPQYCRYNQFLGYQEMDDMIKAARIVVTHGGTGTVMQVLSHGKIPIVVPRQKFYKEVVDDHQVLFTKRLAEEGKVIAVLDVNNLGNIIADYDNLLKDMDCMPKENNLDKFVDELDKITRRLFSKNTHYSE